MAAKKRRKKPGLLWRVLFGNNGPTKGEMRKLLGLTFSKTFPIKERDPQTGRIRTRYMRVEADGKVHEVKAPVKKKRTAAKKTTGRRTVSQPSKPSRASKSGSAQPRRRQPAATPLPRRSRSEPMSERVLRNTDGTLAGSRKQKPATYAQAQREVAKAMRNAAAASKRAEELLGWERPPRQR